MNEELHAYTDGGARGNPGPAAIGVVIQRSPTSNIQLPTSIIWEYGEYIGIATNNQAEYRALICALERAKAMGATRLRCFLDSELLVKQLNREYRVKEPTLQPLYLKSYNLAQQFSLITFTHIQIGRA